MAVVGRMQLNHPALGTAGGAGLHSQIESLWSQLSDAVGDRWFSASDFDNGESVDFVHNFDTDITNLRYDLYVYTGGQWVEVTNTSSPALSAFTIVEKVGNEDNALTVTNVSGGNDLIVAFAIFNDPMRILGNDFKDVDNTTAIEDGQTFVYDSVSGKMKPGASGDSSFKAQSVSTPNATFKGGFMIDDAGREYVTYNGSTDGADFVANLTTVFGSSPSNATTYWCYIDRQALGSLVTDATTGRQYYRVTQSQLSLQTVSPISVDKSRYIPLALFKTATTGNAWSGTGSAFRNLAFRRHQLPSVNVNPLVQTIFEDRSIGEVGMSDDGYGALALSHIGSAPTTGNTSVYNLAGDGSDAGGGGRTLTNTGVNFTGKGFFGRENVPNGITSTNNLKRTSDSFFNVNMSSGTYSFGVWAYLADWGGSTTMSPIHIGDSTNFLVIQKTGTVIRLLGTAGVIQSTLVSTLAPGWHHFTGTISAGTGKFYVDGQLAGTSTGFTTNITGSIGVVGNHNDGTQPWPGLLQDAFFTSQLLTDAQVLDLASKRYTGAQVSAGHHLDADSFPFASLSGRAAFFNLQTNSNDGSVNAKNLSGGTQPVFTGLGLFGAADAAVFNGTTTTPLSTDAFFNPGNGQSLAIGAWFALDDWTPSATMSLICQSGSAADRTYNLELSTAGVLGLYGTNTAGAWDSNLQYQTYFTDGSWHFICMVFDYSAGLLKLYVDGVMVQSVALSNIRAATSSAFRFGAFGSTPSAFMKGRMNDGFYIKGYAPTDLEILKLMSTRIDLVGASASVAVANRIWEVRSKNEDGYGVGILANSSWLLDQKPSKVYANFGSGDGKVTLKCYDGGLSTTVVPVRDYLTTYTSQPGSSVAHGLPEKPVGFSLLYNAAADGKYKPLNAETYIIGADATNIYFNTSALSALTIDATHQLEVRACMVPTVSNVVLPYQGGFSKIVGSGGYATISAAVAASVAGDSILVMQNTSEPTGDLNINVANLRIAFMPNCVATIAGALTNGLRLTAAQILIERGRFKFEPTGAQARGFSIEAADCAMDNCELDLNTAQTLTDAVHVTSGGSRAYVQARLKATLGTITTGVTNNDGASSVNVWGA